MASGCCTEAVVVFETSRAGGGCTRRISKADPRISFRAEVALICLRIVDRFERMVQPPSCSLKSLSRANSNAEFSAHGYVPTYHQNKKRKFRGTIGQKAQRSLQKRAEHPT